MRQLHKSLQEQEFRRILISYVQKVLLQLLS